MHPKASEKVPLVVISDSSTIRDWSGLVVELEQSEKSARLAIDLLQGIIASLQVSRQSVLEQELQI